ncbi:DUF883 family protein [Microvirga antarctica]|uniref:DUF883 family protein n=1 Tax=Microvirga antarctica TaxID=2819233 RepID=UPI001B306012|nr:hypothetical protein [Microvirga antarctica]
MSDHKNDPGKSPSSSKQPQGEGHSKSGQSATLASHTSKPLGGQVTDRNRSASDEGERAHLRGLDSAKHLASAAVDGVRDTVGTVKERAGEAIDEASEWAEDTYGRVSHWASDTYENQNERLHDVRERSARSIRRAKGGVQEYVSENPMVVGLVGLAAGLLIGALLPRTRRENEAFGEWADELRHQGVRYAREATQKGREFVEETFEGDDPRFSKHASEFKTERSSPNKR